jgi:hypothetical protein
MFHKYTLQPLTVHDGPLEFEWDADSGELRGRDADQVRAMAAEAARMGTQVGHPMPTTHDTSDPLHNPAHMAVVLGHFWQVSGDLADAYPLIEYEDLPGVVY